MLILLTHGAYSDFGIEGLVEADSIEIVQQAIERGKDKYNIFIEDYNERRTKALLSHKPINAQNDEERKEYLKAGIDFIKEHGSRPHRNEIILEEVLKIATLVDYAELSW